MAIDSRNKRTSIMNLALGARRFVLPNPDGTIDAADRLQFTGRYSGLAAGAVAVIVTTAGSGTVRPRDFTLTLYATVGGGQPLVIGIDPSITALTWTTGIFGGYGTLTIGVAPPTMRDAFGGGGGYLTRPINVAPFALALLRHGQRVVFRGRVMEIVRYEGQNKGIVVDGLGLVPQGSPWYSASATAMTSQAILSTIQPVCAPLLTLGNSDVFTDPGNTHTPAEFDGMDWPAIVEQLAAEANYMYLVYEGGVEFRAKTAPATPDYRISLAGVEISENYRGVVGAGRVRYTEAGVETTYPTTAAAPVYTTAFADRYGAFIETLISADQLTTAGATQFITNYVGTHIDPALAITLDRFSTLARPGGTPAPASSVHAGQWLTVADLPPQLILATQYDGLSDMASATVGAIPPRSYLSQIVGVQQPVRKLVAGLSAGPAGGKRK